MTFPAYYLLGPGRYAERFGLDFEDFAPGQRFRHRPGVTLSQQDNTEHALDTMNSAMLHFDAAYAGHTAWGRPLMVSTLTAQRVMGLCAKTFARRRRVPGFEEISLRTPVFGGDTLYAESEILAVEPGDDPDLGVVRVRTRGLNASGAEVIELRYRVEIHRRGRGPDADPGGPPVAEPRFAVYDLVDGDLRERFGLFFEDCLPGERFVHHPGYTFLREEAIAQARRSMELAPRFHDLEWAERHLDGPPLIAETFVLAAATTAATRTFGRVVANLGWYDIELPVPVRAGDTVRAESEILDARPSRSRPGEGVLSVATWAVNQHGERVLSFRRTLLVHRRGADGPYGPAGYG
ncbi:MaoC family dehydratase [Nonomuraea sp. NN258]|uniref:MaoC family dehydratase n=1 Tax=Nonomuraea antri TaxID=2730852 RepID=UPI001568E41E|nr:MaoC family dehydratase [Nonomuraea antri]NRQ33684.1 MaoC family dehydratase [Nonomuraea antri]